MFKMRTAILGSAAALAMAMPAGAQSYGYSNQNGYGYQQPTYNTNTNCEAERRSNQQAGGLFGAVAGGLLGAAIAGNDDDDNYRRRGHHRYSRGYNRGYRGYRGRHHRDNDSGDQIAGALVGAVVGGLAGGALGGSATNCNTRTSYDRGYNSRYGNTNVAPPTRQAYGNSWAGNNNAQTVTYSQPRYDQTPYSSSDELYGGSTTYSTSPSYGATTTGYNSGYTGPAYDSGECRTVYRGEQPATACNVGGDRWEFVN